MKLMALKDGKTVIVRGPTLEDADSMLQFFEGLPGEDQRYLRAHLLDRRRCEDRIKRSLDGRVFRLIATLGDDIIADGALELPSIDSGRHVGEIRVFVAEAYRRNRLGARLINMLFDQAQRQGMEKVIVRMAAPQVQARKVAERLGFHVDAVLPDYFQDKHGERHDLLVLSCTLDTVWHELKDFYAHDGWLGA